MPRDRKFSTNRELKKILKPLDESNSSGVTLLYENGIEYVDDSESHVAGIGRTGVGKSQCVSASILKNAIKKHESCIVVDPKGELLKMVAQFITKEKYKKVLCVDLTNPSKSPTKWEPLNMAYKLYKSMDIKDQDDSYSLVNSIYNAVYPFDPKAERFWNDSAINFAKAITYALFDLAEGKEVNMENVSNLMRDSELRTGPFNNARALYDVLKEGSIAKKDISGYAFAPNETRTSIYTSAMCGMEKFSMSKGLSNLISTDTLDILNLNSNEPFLLFIILPDESSEYHSLAGLLVSQVALHLVRESRRNNGRLNIRVNFILEELGSIGSSIPNLPFLMAAGRSRNIRMFLLFQSYSQLSEIYGKNNAETIISCIGISICFSSSDYDTLELWSKLCGENRYFLNGNFVSEKIIYPNDLSAMSKGQALILINGRYKYITRLKMFYENYDIADEIEIKWNGNEVKKEFKGIKYADLISRAKEPMLSVNKSDIFRDINSFISEDNKKQKGKKYIVSITSFLNISEKKKEILKTKIKDMEGTMRAEIMLDLLPYQIECKSYKEACERCTYFWDLGVEAFVKEVS